MKQTFFFTAWLQRATLLLTSLLAFSFTASAQANYWSVFGATGSGCTSATDCNRMMATITPPAAASFKGMVTLNDPSHTSGTPLFAANSVYSGNGQLVFSVDQNGIYNPDGSPAFPFNTTATFYPNDGTNFYTVYPSYAISEICTFPCGNNNNSYYAVFWAYDNDYSLRSPTCVLRAIRIDVSTSGTLTCTDNILYDITSPHEMIECGYGTNAPSSFTIAADAATCGNSRNVYTSELTSDISGDGSNIRKWVFPANGSLPSTTTPTFFSGQYYPAYTPKAKILTVSGKKYYSFICGDYLGSSIFFHAHSVAMIDISDPVPSGGSAAVTSYDVGYTPQDIYGFEHVTNSSGDYIYISYIYYSTANGVDPTNSGLSFFNTIPSGVSTSFTHIPSTSGYSFTDLELDAGGDLLMANGTPTSSPITGTLAYLSKSSFGSSTVPTQINNGCSTMSTPEYYSVANSFNISATFGNPFYLGKQIVGENYNNWGGAPYTVSGAQTWSPGSNPFGNTGTIDVNGIIIPAGCSLTITGMTLQNAAGSNIDVDAGTTLATPGGRLVLNNTTLTNNPTGCTSSSSNMWGGVRVWGVQALSQQGAGATVQGLLTMTGSTISYAQTGVALGAPLPSPLHLFTASTYQSGGIINAIASTFKNNSIGVQFYPYRNIVGSGEVNNRSSFDQCIFTSTDITTVSSSLGNLYEILGDGVKNIPFYGCTFTNTTGTTLPSYGIYAIDMGIIVGPVTSGVLFPVITARCNFTGFTNGIYHSGLTGGLTVNIENAVFTDNTIGINLSATVAPVVVGNTFNVPQLTPASSMPYFITGIRSIGLLLNTADVFSVYSNTFQSTLTNPSSNWAVGINAVNTDHGGEDNLINNNSFVGLGAGNLANYTNNGIQPLTHVIHGLWYKCNTNKDNNFDISSVGSNPSIDGIRPTQGYPAYGAYPTGSSTYPNGLPAGNTFTSSVTVSIPAYNLWNQNCIPLDAYYYAPASYGGLQSELPGVPPTTANDGGASGGTTYAMVSPSPSGAADQCALPGTGPNPGPGPILNGNVHIGHRMMLPPQGSSPDLVYLYTLNNINYYLTDEEGVKHRDQLYYWVSQLHNAAGDLLLANLLVEDGLTDLANIAYDAIPFTYSLDSMETLEFIQGRKLMDIMISNRIHHPGHLLTLDSGQARTLRGIAADARAWAHVKAETWLYQHDGTPFADSLLYPTPPPPPSPGAKGELAVTEISNGPSGNCEYVEMIVANCGTDTAQTVDISGWIIDDNAGNFNTHGCGITNLSTSIGHYRFAKISFWQNVPVGSIIVMYNHDDNCYNLPGLLVDTTATGLVYCIPIGGTVLDPYGNTGVERYLTLPNLLQCSYCTNDYHIPYVPASDWVGTIGLDNAGDAIQVRCPGCDSANPSGAAFYHGIGYGPSSGPDAFATIAVGDNNLGGAVINGSGAGSKYVFNGSAAADLGDPTMWTKSTANEAGSRPISLGKVNDAFMSAVTSHTLDLPCCGGGGGSALRGGGGSPSVPAINNNGDISVYPNPANTTLYFQFPASGTVIIRLVDVSGQLMSEQVVNNVGTASINVNDYVPGIYLYQVITDTKTQSGKVLIGR